MDHDDRSKTPIWQITIGEFEKLVKVIVADEISKSISRSFEEQILLNSNEDVDIINVQNASRITGLCVSTIYSKVSRFEMPSTTRGRPLLFSRKELIFWIENGRTKII